LTTKLICSSQSILDKQTAYIGDIDSTSQNVSADQDTNRSASELFNVHISIIKRKLTVMFSDRNLEFSSKTSRKILNLSNRLDQLRMKTSDEELTEQKTSVFPRSMDSKNVLRTEYFSPSFAALIRNW